MMRLKDMYKLGFSSVKPVSGALSSRCIQLDTEIHAEKQALRCKLLSASEWRARQGDVTVECCNIAAESTKSIEQCEYDRTVNTVRCSTETVKICGSSFRECRRMCRLSEISGVGRSGFMWDSK